MSREIVERFEQILTQELDRHIAFGMTPSAKDLTSVLTPEIERLLAQARAEVLAAVLAKMDGPKMNHADLYRAIQELQPAASALKDLLREAELKGILLVHLFKETHTRCRACKRIAELEKAHATPKRQ